VTPADVCGAIVFCDAITQAIANAIAWGKVGAVVAALALTYGVAMSIAFFVYVCRSRGQRIARWTNERAPERADSTSSAAREQSSP
jgi:ABC-type nickel/cobalt efflux system permease component RcnA